MIKEGTCLRLRCLATSTSICCLGMIAAGAPVSAGEPGKVTGVPNSVVQIDISGVESWDQLFDPDNVVLTRFLGPGAVVTGVGWDLTLTTFGSSWLSEAEIYFDASDQDGLGLIVAPGAGNNMPGSMSLSSGGILDLSDLGISNLPILGDGLLYLQFYESVDHISNVPDAIFEPGSFLDVAYVFAGALFFDSFESGDTSNWGSADTEVTIDFDLLGVNTVVVDQYCQATFLSQPGFEIRTAAVGIAPSPPHLICTAPIGGGGPTCTSEIRVQFAAPVDGLSFRAVGAKAPPGAAVAQVEVFANGMLLGTEDVVSPGDSSIAFLVDLTAYPGVTEIVISGTSDPAGLGYDDFVFTWAPMPTCP